jgi:hypothetical protein
MKTEHEQLNELGKKWAEVKEAREAKSQGHSPDCDADLFVVPPQRPCTCGQHERIDRNAQLWTELEALLEKI